MPRGESKRDQFETRRRKEQVAFLVVKFLRASVVFDEIDREFESFARSECLEDCRLFEKVRGLVGGLLFDMKESAHALFRSDLSAARARPRHDRRGEPGAAAGAEDAAQRHEGRRSVSRSSTETRSLDSLIGTGYHLMLILQETLYQIERYAPELEKEKDEIGAKVAADTAELAGRVMERCRALFKGTAEVIRRFVAKSHDNEILVLNLVQNTGLLEKVYGAGSAEELFSAVCRGHDLPGATAYERALSFVRERCGNITALPPASSPRSPARASAS